MTPILVPEDSGSSVFFNPRMELNRSITCAVIRGIQTMGEEIQYLDLLSGTGSKGLRVAVETGSTVHLNDGNPQAVDVIEQNVALNGLDARVTHKDANLLLLESLGEFNFIDIDPFGPPTPFLDPAMMAIKKGGYMGVTATDTAPLCGVYPAQCFRKYGSWPAKGHICHEVGLRILISYIARTAMKYAKGIQVLLSHSTEHYFRVYVKVIKGKSAANENISQLGFVYLCRKCLEIEYEKIRFPVEKICRCGEKFNIAGPVWLGQMKDENLFNNIFSLDGDIDEKTLKYLESLGNESPALFYHNIHKICKFLKKSALPMESIIQEIHNKGYSATRTHFSPVSLKSDMKLEELKKILDR